MRRSSVVISAAIFLAACDGNGQVSTPTATPSPSPTPSPTPTPTATKVGAQIDPAEVAVLPLADLGITADAVFVSIDSGTSGVVAGSIKMADGQLRILAPGDTGKDELFTIRLREADGDMFDVAVTMNTALSTQIATAEDTPEDEAAGTATLPALGLTGVDTGSRLTGAAIRVSVAGAPKFSTTVSSAYIIDSLGAKRSVSTLWSYDAATNSFNLSADQAAALRDALPEGQARLVIGLISEDGNFAGTYSANLFKGSSRVEGRIIDIAGTAVTTLSGRLVAIVGKNTNVRRVVTVGADGRFAADGLPPDTYLVQLLDLDRPGFTGGFFAIFNGASTASADLTYVAPGATAQSVSSGKLFSSARAFNTGKAPPSRAKGEQAPPAASSCSSSAGSLETFTVAASQQNVTQSCDVSYVAPKGTGFVEMRVTVTTAEYPTYTQSNSKYNDQWSFSFSNAPGLPTPESGSVNNSHYNSGSFTRTKCLDLSTLTKDASHTIIGTLKSVNIGDSSLSTVVSASFNPGGCGLQVTKADFTTPNKSGKKVMLGRNANNVVGPFLPYLSIPQATAIDTYGVPFEINYAPKDATLSKVELGIIQNGTVVAWTGDIRAQATSTTPGKLVFKDFIFPVMPFDRQGAYLSFTVRLTGTVNGQSTTSPTGEQNVMVEGSTLFTPLFLAGDDTLLSGLRYNQPSDAGGDSWATQATIAWLRSKPFRFDDISALHAGRAANKCRGGTLEGSVLGHCGHSNGQEVDLRYATPEGTYTSAIGESGGGGLSTLLTASKTGGSGSAATTRLVQWITNNRTMITNAAAEARTLEIWFGKEDYLLKALVLGKYPDGTAIKYAVTGGADVAVGEWAKPVTANAAPHHDTHWHISRNAP